MASRVYSPSTWREKIIEGGNRGRHAKAQSGQWVGTGMPPFGYRREGARREAHLVIELGEAEVVQRIFTMYVGGQNEAPMSSGAIASKLTRDGVTSPVGRGIGVGRGWCEKTIRRIIERPAYVGYFKYGEHSIHLPDLAIVSHETYDAAQKQTRINSKLAKRNAKRDYLLSGCIKCTCGATMSASLAHKRLNLSYYRCQVQTHYRYMKSCNESHLRTDTADQLIWNWILSLLESEDSLHEGIHQMQQRAESELAPKRQRITILSDLIEKTERKIRRLAAQLGESDDETLVDAIKAEMKSAVKHKDSLTDELRILQSEVERHEVGVDIENKIKEMAQKVRDRLRVLEFAEKRQLIGMLDLRAQLRRDENNCRWLDVSCGIVEAPKALLIDCPPSTKKQALSASRPRLARASGAAHWRLPAACLASNSKSTWLRSVTSKSPTGAI